MRKAIAAILRALAAFIEPRQPAHVQIVFISPEANRIIEAIKAGAVVEVDTEPYQPISEDELAAW